MDCAAKKTSGSGKGGGGGSAKKKKKQSQGNDVKSTLSPAVKKARDQAKARGLAASKKKNSGMSSKQEEDKRVESKLLSSSSRTVITKTVITSSKDQFDNVLSKTNGVTTFYYCLPSEMTKVEQFFRILPGLDVSKARQWHKNVTPADGRENDLAKKFNVDWEKYGPVFALPKRDVGIQSTWFWDSKENMWSGAELIERTQRFMKIVVESSLGYPIKMLTEHGETDKKKGVKTLLGELLDMSRDEGNNSKKLKSSRTKILLPATTPQDIRKRKEKDWMDPDVDEEEEADTWVATTPPTPLHLLFQIIRDAYTQCEDNDWLDDDAGVELISENEVFNHMLEYYESSIVTPIHASEFLYLLEMLSSKGFFLPDGKHVQIRFHGCTTKEAREKYLSPDGRYFPTRQIEVLFENPFGLDDDELLKMNPWYTTKRIVFEYTNSPPPNLGNMGGMQGMQEMMSQLDPSMMQNLMQNLNMGGGGGGGGGGGNGGGMNMAALSQMLGGLGGGMGGMFNGGMFGGN